MKNYFAKLALLSTVLFVLLIAACAKPDATTNREASATNSSAKSSGSPATTTASNTGEIGVPECDVFLKSYETCVKDKVPEAVRPTFESTIARWKKAWRDEAADPTRRAALVTACKTAHEQAKSAMKAYGCTLE